MKKKIKIAGYVKNSFVDYPSKISFVIFLGGCNFVCHYCHNSHILINQSNTISFDEVLSEIKQQIGFIDGVVISGGEPTLHPNLYDIIKEIKKMGLLVKVDTNGTNSDILKDLTEKKLIDFVAMDIKAPLERYKDIIQIDKVQLENYEQMMENVKESISFLISQQEIDYQFRTTLSPLLTEKDIKNIGKLINGARCFALQQFVPNNFSNSHKTVLLPYSRTNAEKFGLLLSKHVEKFITRGF